VEVLVAVGTPWQGDFWRQEGLTESQKGGSKKIGRRPWNWRTISFTSEWEAFAESGHSK